MGPVSGLGSATTKGLAAQQSQEKEEPTALSVAEINSSTNRILSQQTPLEQAIGNTGQQYQYTGPGSSPGTGGLPEPSNDYKYTGPGSSPGTGGLPEDWKPASPAEVPPASDPEIGLSDADFQSAADQLGVDVATVKAIAEVESAGAGFLPSGDPSILFEAHIFGARTGDVYNESHPHISGANWGDVPYGASGQHQHDRLADAIALDETAALQSASWGQFQIMGFNHEAAGYDNVQDFVAAMRESESNQLDAFVSFVGSHPGMVTALQDKDWASFASQYNGPGYAQNSYDTKIANAYARHSN